MSSLRELQNAHTLFKDGDLDAAEKICQQVLEEDPAQAKAYQLLALIFVKRGDFKTAEQHILKALEIAPDDAEALNSYGNILKSTGRWAKAQEAYRQSLDIAPNYIQALQSLGELYLLQKDPMKAAAIFTQGLEHYPKHPVLSRGLLFALKDSQQTDIALSLLAEMPQSVDLAYTTGQLLAQNNQNVQAKAAFSQALSHAPTAPMALRNIIQLIWMEDGFEAAKSTLMGMVSQNSNAAFIYLLGAELLSAMGDRDGAGSLLVQSEETFGSQPDILLARANMAIDNNEGAQAWDLIRQALSQRPGDPALASSYARAALMVGDFKAALQASQNMNQYQPNNQFWIAIQAMALRGLGDESYHSLYNYERFVRAYKLETPPEYETRDIFLKKLKTDLGVLHAHHHHPIGQSLRQGTQTSADLRFAKSRVIQDFFQALHDPITDYMGQIGTDKTHPLTRRNQGRYRLSGAWSVLLQGAGYHVNHVHPEGWISSAFYVDVPKGIKNNSKKRGWIQFGEPPFEVPDMEAEHKIAPEPGLLVLFPSYMWHGTIPITKKSKRMTLPFDVVPA